jgi:hypothetical protein
MAFIPKARQGAGGGALRASAAMVATCLVGVSLTLDAATVSDPHATTCAAVSGTIVPNCNAGICGQGVVQGDLRGTFTSKVTSIYPAGSGWLYSSWTRIELDGKKGRIETLNEGTTPLDAKGGPDLLQSSEVLSLTEAAGAYEGYSGTIVIVGGHAVGRPAPYSGRLCHSLTPK